MKKISHFRLKISHSSFYTDERNSFRRYVLSECWYHMSSIHFSFQLDENKFERLPSNRSNVGNLLKCHYRIFSILVFITFLWHKHVISVAWTVPAFLSSKLFSFGDSQNEENLTNVKIIIETTIQTYQYKMTYGEWHSQGLDLNKVCPW